MELELPDGSIEVGLSSGAGTLWSRRESGRSPPPGTQGTIDTALESSRWGQRSFVEYKCSFEAGVGCDASLEIWISGQPPRVVDDRTFRPLRRHPAR
eukprot:scaffold21016_cov102-Phaeocystis_antarctica.AAC.1